MLARMLHMQYVRAMTYPDEITTRLAAMGAKFRGARVEAGFKQEEVGARLGRSQSYVSVREAGQAAFDVADLLIAAAMFGVDFQELTAPKPRTLQRAA